MKRRCFSYLSETPRNLVIEGTGHNWLDLSHAICTAEVHGYICISSVFVLLSGSVLCVCVFVGVCLFVYVCVCVRICMTSCAFICLYLCLPMPLRLDLSIPLPSSSACLVYYSMRLRLQLLTCLVSIRYR